MASNCPLGPFTVTVVSNRFVAPFPDVSDRSIEQLISLKHRSAVITGGARGLGLAIARRFAEAGAVLTIGDIDEASAKASADQITRDFGCDVVTTPLDVADPDSVQATAERAIAAFGRIDIWVNNAGIYPSSPITEMTENEWDRVIDTNLRGTFLGCREAARRMIAVSRGGVIINLSSVAGVGGRGPGVSHYVASKHGVVGMTKQLALELVGKGIRVLAVAPAIIRTPGVESSMAERATEAGVGLNELLSGLMGRAGKPDDVARVVLFCASDLSMFMTGSTLLVDGGEMAR